jgi:hypothetical protein
MSATNTNGGPPRGALLVGSVPLANDEEVFRTTSEIVGDRVRRIPDGETGDRINWIGWQYGVLAAQPQIEPVPPDPEHYAPLPQVKLRSGVRSEDVTFRRLGYADAAKASYQTFKRLRGEGTIPTGVRFQVSLPTPLAPVTAFVLLDDRAVVEPPYEAAMLVELNQIVTAIPAEDLAIQWDVAVEFGILEGIWPAFFDNVEPGIVERLVRLGDAVPEPVELGYHLCYGDYEHHHFTQPTDAGRLVAIANAVAVGVRRAINWIHLPVPRDRVDDAYFAPLRDLRLAPETELYLGLVHATDGVEGTRRRIETARKVVPTFGVATECGLGRRPAETIPDVLRIHAEVAGPVM